MAYIALSPRASVQYMPYSPRARVITITYKAITGITRVASFLGSFSLIYKFLTIIYQRKINLGTRLTKVHALYITGYIHIAVYSSNYCYALLAWVVSRFHKGENVLLTMWLIY